MLHRLFLWKDKGMEGHKLCLHLSCSEHLGFCRELDRLSADTGSAISKVGGGIFGKGLREAVEGCDV